jgi:hypothetical protein
MSADVINISDRIPRTSKAASASANKRPQLFSAVGSALFGAFVAALKALAWIAKTLVYLVLVLFAGPARMILGLAMIATAIGLPMIFFGYRHDPAHQHQFLGILALLGLGSAAVLVIYEQLLMRLAPQPPVQVVRSAE